MPGKLLPNKDGMSKVAIQEIADRIEMARPRVLEELSWICKSREGKLTSTQVRAVADVISHLVPVTDVATVLCEWLMQNGGDPGAAWDWKESPQGRACIEAAAISDGPRRDLPAGRLRDLFLIKDAEAEAMELRQLVSERIRSRLRRRAEGAKPRKAVAQIEQPWVAEGISRATWFRKRSAEREIETPSDPIERARKADRRDESAYNTIGLLGVSPELSPSLTRLPTAEGRRYASLALRCGLIPIRLNNHPLTCSYRGDAFWLRDEPVPSIGAVIHDVRRCLPYLSAEPVTAEKRPDIFHRIELW